MLWFNQINKIDKHFLRDVLNNEGMSETPYIDVLVKQNPEQHDIPPDELAIIEKHLDKLKLTFGIGLTYITEKEALKVTEMRLEEIKGQVIDDYPHITNRVVLDVLTEMQFQLGRNGLSKFKKMHKAIKDKEYVKAVSEMKNSAWYVQTPNRVNKLAQKLLEA